MENEKIAELISERLYNPNLSETDFAIQLFIEKFVLPTKVRSYTNLNMKRYILLALEQKDRAIEWQKHTDSIRQHEREET